MKLVVGKYKEQLRIAVDSTEHTVRTAEKNFYTES